MARHLGYVFAGEYDVPVPDNSVHVVLDIGANCGAYTIWAGKRWPGSRIIAYEPSLESYGIFTRNVASLGARVIGHRLAITSEYEAIAWLHDGLNNTGERSLHLLGEQHSLKGERVFTRHPAALPECDILKIDVEGCELDILRHYGYLDRVAAVTLEWHKREEVPQIIAACEGVGLEPHRDDWTATGRILKFVRPK
jgi:FkbM family methyltransferase